MNKVNMFINVVFYRYFADYDKLIDLICYLHCFNMTTEKDASCKTFYAFNI